MHIHQTHNNGCLYMKKKRNLLKISVLASTIALALAGCNSDGSSTGTSDSGSAGTGDSSSASGAYTLQAIDGYLVNAEVYADIDQNGTLSDSDKMLGTTGENGTFTVESDYQDYPIIIKAIAGQTFDTDTAGTLTSNVELIAEKGSAVVTPFSTYAVKTGKTLDEVAAELQMDVSMISSDYIASKSNADKATKETIQIAPFGIAELINLDIFNDINILFGSKGTGKTEILRALSTYYNGKGFKTEVYESNSKKLEDVLNPYFSLMNFFTLLTTIKLSILPSFVDFY